MAARYARLTSARHGCPPPSDAPACPVVAMVGGGQLARMTHQAGDRRSASRCGCSPPPRDESAALVAADVAHRRPHATSTTLPALRRRLRRCVTFDHELVIDPAHMAALEADGHTILRPSAGAARLRPGQAAPNGARFAAAGLLLPVPLHSGDRDRASSWRPFAGQHGWPVIAQGGARRLRRQGRLGVGGTGQAPTARRGALIAEEYLAFDRELAVWSPARRTGRARSYPGGRDVQATASPRGDRARARAAPGAAPPQPRARPRIADDSTWTGVLAVELFETERPAGQRARHAPPQLRPLDH